MRKLWTSATLATPGVYRRALIRGPRIVDAQHVSSTEAHLDQMLRGRTEILFHQLYDAVALRFAAEFRDLAEPDAEDLRLLARLAESVDLKLTSEEERASDLEVDQIVWRDAARASTLTLFDFIAAALTENHELAIRDAHVSVSADKWASLVAEHPRFDRSYFSRISGLVGDEVDQGLEIAARAAIEWEVFSVPGAQLLYGDHRIVVIALPDAQQLECVLTDAPTVALLTTSGAAIFDENCLVFPADHSVVQAISMPLFWLQDNDGIVVATGDGERMLPTQCALRLRLDGARVQGDDESLAFTAEQAGGTVAIQAAAVQRLGAADTFLLKGDCY